MPRSRPSSSSRKRSSRRPSRPASSTWCWTWTALAKGLTPSEDELRKFYADNAARFTAVEERRASHILIKADKDTPAAERQKAKARAEELLAEVRKNPAGFADLARKNSQDTGSAAQGGDLDFFGRGAMVKPFEDAVFALKPGEISNVVESDFGYHVILLAEVRGGQKKPFDAVRAEIETSLRQAWRRSAGPNWPSSSPTSSTNSPTASSRRSTSSSWNSRPPPCSAPRCRVHKGRWLGQVPRRDLRQRGRGQQAQHRRRGIWPQPAGGRPRGAAQPGAHAAAGRGEGQGARAPGGQDGRGAGAEGRPGTRLAAVQKNGPPRPCPAPAIVSRAQTQGCRAVLDAVLSADAGKLPAVIGVDLKDQGYIVVRVTKLLPRERRPGGDAPCTASTPRVLPLPRPTPTSAP
jgi:peptidyl-prolyl cis-trans isomerase D